MSKIGRKRPLPTIRRLRELLAYDPLTGIFTRKISLSPATKVGDVAGGLNAHGYVQISVDGQILLANRVAWAIMTGAWPTYDVDHENRIRHDNRWVNLREATRSQNLCNSSLRSDSTTGVKGVGWAKREKKWRAYINIDGKTTSLGYYTDQPDAVAARRKAEIIHHGDFAAR